jgi:hypothetical protein
MKKNTLKTAFLTTLLASFFILISAVGVEAQTQSISGDGLCGSSTSTACTPAHLKAIGTKVLTLFVYLGSAILVAVIGIRLVLSVLAYMRGDAGAIKRAGENAFNAFIGFFIVFAVGGGIFLLLLRYFGAQPWTVKLLQMFADSSLIEHAYAQTATTTMLPNPLGSNSAYDLIIAGLSLAMRFFVYPGLIVLWVASGFKFIYSQGNPEGLKTARSWLMWSVIVTIVAFSLQGFILAFRATAERIVPAISSIDVISPEASSRA